MEPITRQTETVNTQTESQTAKRIVGTIFGAIEFLIALRFILKLFGANPDNAFIKFMYSITGIFTVIFDGIFAKVRIGGANSVAVFEPSPLVAMVIIGLIAWFVLKLMTPQKDKRIEKTEVTSNTGNDTTNRLN